MLIKLVELINVYLVEGVLRAELIDLVVDLVVDPSLVVVYCVILYSLPSQFLLQTVHHFNLFELNDNTALSATRYTTDCVRLDCHLNRVVRCNQG